jgi:hypothetical protein
MKIKGGVKAYVEGAAARGKGEDVIAVATMAVTSHELAVI